MGVGPLKERAMLAALAGLLANPNVTNRDALRRLDRSWVSMIAHSADALSDAVLLLIPVERGQDELAPK